MEQINERDVQEAYVAFLSARFAGLDAVAFTLTIEQSIPRFPERLTSPLIPLTEDIANVVLRNFANKVKRKLLGNRMRRRKERLEFFAWVEPDKAGQLHIHGIIAIPPHKSFTDVTRSIRDVWGRDAWGRLPLWREKRGHERQYDFQQVYKSDGWVSYCLKPGVAVPPIVPTWL
jgi:hypothetical protein